MHRFKSYRPRLLMLPYVRIRLVAKRPPPPSYPLDPISLGNPLRKKRLDLGLSQKGLAARLQVSVGTLCNWERDRFLPQKRFIPRLRDFLGYCPLPLLSKARPKLVQAPELHGLDDMRGLDGLAAGQVRDRARDPQDAVQRAG